MSLRFAVLAAGATAGMLLSAASAVLAQAVKPAPAKVESAEAAAAAAAMKRAQRMAANPMKVILQASKIRRRPDVDAAPDAGRASGRAVSASAAVAAAPAAVAVPVSSRAAPVTAPAQAPAAVAPSAPASAVADAAPFTPTAAPAPIEALALAVPATTALAAPVNEPPSTAPLAAQPKLLTMIEPDIPGRLLVEGPRVTEIFADLSLRADGSVGGVTLLPGVPRPWQRYVTMALERWRFEPLPAPRVHRVQLVFGE